MTLVDRFPLVSSGVLVFVLCASSIMWVDRPVAELLKQVVHGDLELFFKITTNLGRAELYMVPAALVWIVAKTKALDAIKQHAAYIFVTMVAAGTVEIAVKFLVGRTRPKLWFEQGLFTIQPLTHGSVYNSFPSGHSQAAWAAMIALSVVFPRYRWAFVAIAVLVALSRVMLTVHWASDAIAGSWLGFAAALLVQRLMLKAEEPAR